MRTALTAAALALVLASCGDSPLTPGAGGSPQPGGSLPSPSPSPAGSRASTPSPAGTTPGSKPGGSTPAPAPLGTSQSGRVALARSCVHRGDAAEPQTLTVTAAPGDTVGYSTYYADYSSELNRPDYTSGFGYGQAGPDGTFRATWVVPGTATPGRATVQVVAPGIEDAESASFLVVEQGHAC